MPIGVAVFALCLRAAAGRQRARGGRQARRRRRGHRDAVADARGLRDRQRQRGRLDVAADARPARRGGGAAGVFLVIESRVRAPLMPLGLFRLRNVATANVVGVLWAAAMFAWFFLSALYMQLVLGYSADAGRPRLPAGQPDHGRVLARAVGEDRHALRHPRRRSAVGLLLAAAGLALFALAPVDGSFVARTCCPAWCCSASAPAWRSTRCCSRR